MSKSHILDDVINFIANHRGIKDEYKITILRDLARLKDSQVNVLITGSVGSGKSSTINALFDADKAKVGIGFVPETMDIKKFELDNIILWDTPGLGDHIEADIRHSKNIRNKLLEADSEGNLLIDLVLVILDGGSRDLGTPFELINNVIIPNLGEDKKRLLVAINQADTAMKGRHWDYENNEPKPELVKFLNEKVESTRKRIYEATGVNIEPIYYSAGYKDGDDEQKPYNLSKLLAFILRHTKKEKRIVFAQDINKQKAMWEKDDRLENYQQEIKQSFVESAVEAIRKGVEVVQDVIEFVGDVIDKGIEIARKIPFFGRFF